MHSPLCFVLKQNSNWELSEMRWGYGICERITFQIFDENLVENTQEQVKWSEEYTKLFKWQCSTVNMILTLRFWRCQTWCQPWELCEYLNGDEMSLFWCAISVTVCCHISVISLCRCAYVRRPLRSNNGHLATVSSAIFVTFMSFFVYFMMMHNLKCFFLGSMKSYITSKAIQRHSHGDSSHVPCIYLSC